MFVYSLSIIFLYTDFFKPLGFFLLLGGIFGIDYFTAPEPNIHWHEEKFKNLYFMLQTCWLGQASLWRAFWPFFVLANIAFFYIDYRITNSSYTLASWRTVHFMLFLPTVWWVRSVWKCSTNTSKKIWSTCARSIAVYFVIDFFLRLFISFEYSHIILDCTLLEMENGECLPKFRYMGLSFPE